MTSFSKAWRLRCSTKAAQKDRRFLKNQRSRKARREAKRDPYAALPKLSSWDVI